MLVALNQLVDTVEDGIGEELDLVRLASRHGTTEHHLRRMFSSLAGMPLSEYVRRRRMTRAAADLVSNDDDLLTIAVRYGYGSAEAFGRAFRAVHAVGPNEARRAGGPFRTQQALRFRLTVEGSTPMRVRIIDQPAQRLVGYATEVPLIYEGVNPQIQEHIASLPPSSHQELKALGDGSPSGILQVTLQEDPPGEEGSALTYLHGVAVTGEVTVPDALDVIEMPAGAWAVFTSEGPHPAALQQVWAATAAEWFPSNPWRLRSGPSVVAIIEHDAQFSHATCELWLPVEPTTVQDR